MTYELRNEEDALYSFIFEVDKRRRVFSALPLESQAEAIFSIMVIEVIKTSEIESENLNKQVVVASSRKRVGLSESGIRLTTLSISVVYR